jgi:hypothetical protein
MKYYRPTNFNWLIRSHAAPSGFGITTILSDFFSKLSFKGWEYSNICGSSPSSTPSSQPVKPSIPPQASTETTTDLCQDSIDSSAKPPQLPIKIAPSASPNSSTARNSQPAAINFTTDASWSGCRPKCTVPFAAGPSNYDTGSLFLIIISWSLSSF